MSKPRVLLINPVVGDDYEFTRINRPMPLGLLSIASMLIDTCDVTLLDQRMDENFSGRLQDELEKKPLFAGLHVMGGPQIRTSLTLTRTIKDRSDTPVVWGGAFPTMVPDAVIAHELVQFVIRGEGEIPVKSLAETLASGASPEGVPSLTWKRGGQVIHNDLAPQIALDDLPDLPYDLVDLRHYDWSAGINQPLKGLKLQIESSRGCSSRCIFCYNPFFYQKSWRALSAKRTVDRMEELIRRGAVHIDVIDDSFFEDLERVGLFAREILDRGLSIRYLLNGGKVEPILRMPAADLDALKKSGCHTIHLGAESGSDRVLQKIAKGITQEQIRASNIRLRDHGIRPSYYFIFGAPGENKEDLHESVQTIFGILGDNADAKIIAAFSFTPFAQTPGFKIAVSHGMPVPDTLDGWSRFDTLNTLQPWLTAEEKKRVRSLFFLAMFIDDKINDLSPSTLIRFIAGVYRPFARFRMKHLMTGFFIEEKIGRYVLKLVQERGRRRLMK